MRPSPVSPLTRRSTLSRDAGEGKETLLVYRHRLAPLSEVSFLSRFYADFEHLAPTWLGYHLDAGLGALQGGAYRLGRPGTLGALDRILFRHAGIMPPQPDLRALHPRLIHAHFGPGGAFALPLARALDIPLVVTFHGADVTKDTHYRRRLIPRIYARRLDALQREAALFVCVSEFVRDTLLARGFPSAKLEVIHQGVDIPVSPPIEKPPAEAPYILFVGRFVEKKGAAYLIEAMRRLDDVGLVLIGDGPLAGTLRQQARRLRRVEFPGWLPNAEVRRWMRGAAALCVPSVTAPGGDSEGLPTVIFEAMAEGLPVIGSRHAGIAEAVEHGNTGLLVPPGDPEALALALDTLVRQTALQHRLGGAARLRAAERFNALDQSRRLEAALLRVSE